MQGGQRRRPVEGLQAHCVGWQTLRPALHGPALACTGAAGAARGREPKEKALGPAGGACCRRQGLKGPLPRCQGTNQHSQEPTPSSIC